ncbi:SHOCT domain-containing protein, partial [Staphylococcus aureus]
SVADELIKYKELLDVGVISQEEFDKKKQQLLDID